MGAARQSQRYSLQQVVVQVECVQALEAAEGVAVDVASTKPVVVKQQVLKILHSAEGIDLDRRNVVLLQVEQHQGPRET